MVCRFTHGTTIPVQPFLVAKPAITRNQPHRQCVTPRDRNLHPMIEAKANLY
jgi:hypothetical protein